MFHYAIKPPVVRLQPKSGIEQVMVHASRIASILLGVVALVVVLHLGRTILAPITLAVVIGLMFGPLADRFERKGVKPAFSSAIVVLLFLASMVALALAFSLPLTEWAQKIPQIWAKLRHVAESWRDTLASVAKVSDQLKGIDGQSGLTVQVDEGNPAVNAAFLAPELLAQCALFLTVLYFFIATRHDVRNAILRLCMGRRLRWRMAHIFRDAERLVSHYLLAITGINLLLGASVALAMSLLGVPSPFLWGLLAAILNYVVYIGPAAMVAILVAVGVSTFGSMPMMLAPAGTYLVLNLIESQLLTPNVLGRRLELNPFIVFLAFVFWLWLWGPVGGFVAVPLLLIGSVTITHMLPLLPTRRA
jgi:predicted PurR-regulated permease PerM